jgi:putative membrane protein
MYLLASIHPAEVVGTIFYTALGVAMMALCWWVITRIAPFPLVKEIEQDQNVALAVLIGAVFISLAIIIAAVILS